MSFGANAADPHHMPDDTKLKVGDVVLFDVGCRQDEYCSDMTRTFFWNEPTAKQREVYELVRRANEAGRAAVHPGARFCDIDKAARDVIAEAGYGEYFTHRLGHQIGLDEHEPETSLRFATRKSRSGCVSPSNRESICQASSACASRTWCA